MAPQIELDELMSAWRALAVDAQADGLRTIPIGRASPPRLRAGRHAPGDFEAVLAGFAGVRLPANGQLPQGRGFAVEPVNDGDLGNDLSWLSLRRLPTGSLDMFTLMARDVVHIMEHGATQPDQQRYQAFISRIIAWQSFMERGTDGVLGPEAEVGLVGEILILVGLIETGVIPASAVESWQGPIDGIHDFVLGTGSIEVKTTIAPSGFVAMVGSLDQLDDCERSPMFVAAVRLALHVGGSTLPEIIERARTAIDGDLTVRQALDLRLIHAGYFDVAADRYTRRFHHVATRFLVVDNRFPRIARSKVDPRIREARYNVDLDAVDDPVTTMSDALAELGHP